MIACLTAPSSSSHKNFEHFANANTATNADTNVKVQSTLVISKSKGPTETLRDIRGPTYQMCGIEENTN